MVYVLNKVIALGAVCLLSMSFLCARDSLGAEERPARPQEPQAPYPYLSEEVSFENRTAGITLAGTLTMPRTGNMFPAVVLITGSGPQNRDEETAGHKPFLVISDYLTRQGIAVLRYDDRGVAHSTGDFQTGTVSDFAGDAESAVAYLKTRKEIDTQKIGLIGHSQGGIVAAIVASRSENIGFMALLAAIGLRGDEINRQQQTAVWRASDVPEELIAGLLPLISKMLDKIIDTDYVLSQQEIADFMTGMKDEISEGLSGTAMTVEEYVEAFAPQFASPVLQYSIRFDPAPVLEKVTCPVFAVNGTKDWLVESESNLAAIRHALEKGGNKNVTLKEYPDLNHLFQECTTGALTEYAEIEQTFSPEVLQDLSDWIRGLW